MIFNILNKNGADVSGVTASNSDILVGKDIVDNTGLLVHGTMTNNGAILGTIDGLATTSYTVSRGYHNGNGVVVLTDDIESYLDQILTGKNLVSIAVTGSWTNTQYTNFAVDITGLSVIATFDDGSTSNITSSSTVSPSIWANTQGTQTVTFTYTFSGVTRTATKTAEVTKLFYTEVEYLESTGMQYIDTGYIINTATDEVELYYQLLDGLQYKWIFGEHDNGARFGLGSGDGTNKRNVAYGAGTSQKADSYFFNSQHYYKATTSGVYIDNVKMVNYSNFSSYSTIYLFNLNLKEGTYGTSSRIWGYQHKRNKELILDLIPVLDKNDRPAMYDRVSGQMFYNQGTGEFLYGGVV